MKNKILNITEILKAMRSYDCSLVTGSFDIVHLGHLRFLSKAKNLYPKNKLVCVLLSNKSIQERKGIGRPVFDEKYRAEFLSFLDAVDYVSIWDKDWQALREFVQSAKPSVYITNSDDTGLDNKRSFIESYGGKFITLKKDDTYSTSSIIKKIKDS